VRLASSTHQTSSVVLRPSDTGSAKSSIPDAALLDGGVVDCKPRVYGGHRDPLVRSAIVFPMFPLFDVWR
jgi:hypothetical protein